MSIEIKIPDKEFALIVLNLEFIVRDFGQLSDRINKLNKQLEPYFKQSGFFKVEDD